MRREDSVHLKHRRGVMTSGAVAIASFLPDVTENLVSDQPVCRGGMAGNGWWGAGAGWGGSGSLLGWRMRGWARETKKN